MKTPGFNLTPGMGVVLVLIATLLLLFPSLFNGWVNWDDENYVLNNPLVQNLSFEGVIEMFTTLEVQGNYHPLSLLSLALDFQFSAKEPFMYHLTNLLLHLLNTGLVLVFIYRLIHKIQPAVLSALLFGIHPMHIESVAWISERKDVLYTFFFLGGLICYINYLQKRVKSYLWLGITLLVFTFSLLSKAMAVTFPLILLLLDYLKERQDYKQLILEKIPFMVLSLGFGVLAIIAQRAGKALTHAPDINLLESVVTALNGLFLYTVKAFYPFKLSTLHPYAIQADGGLPLSMYLCALFALIILVFALIRVNKNRLLIFGLGVYLISLAPVLQLLPVGNAMIAERYTYIAYIGLFLMMALGVEFLQTKGKELNSKISLLSHLLLGIYLIFMMSLSFFRIPVWENGGTLWSDVIDKYPDHFFAYASRGLYWAQENQAEKAMPDLNAALVRNPGFAEAYINRGLLYAREGNHELALKDYQLAIDLDSLDAMAYLNRGALLRVLNRLEEAQMDLDLSLELNPKLVMSYHNRGLINKQLGQLPDAIEDFTAALKLDANNPVLWFERAFVYAMMRNYPSAEENFDQAIQLNPEYANAYLYRSLLFFEQGKKKEALADAISFQNLGGKLDPTYWEELNGP